MHIYLQLQMKFSYGIDNASKNNAELKFGLKCIVLFLS